MWVNYGEYGTDGLVIDAVLACGEVQKYSDV